MIKVIKAITFFALKIARISTRFILLVIVFLGAFLASQLVHLGGHILTAEWIGAKIDTPFVYIPSEILLSVTKFIPIASRVVVIVKPVDPDMLLILYLFGGIIAAILPWSMLWLLARHNRKKGFQLLEAISANLFLTHLSYAASELFLFTGDPALHGIVQWILVGIAQFIFAIFYIRPIVRWLRN